MEEACLPKRSFKEQQFWDEFFQARNGQPFEWYAEWPDLSKLLVQHSVLKPQDPPPAILVPGCGNSEISAALYDDGFTNITNIDFCRGVIAEMLRRHLRQRPRMLWKVMDMTKMQFSDSSFDVVIDKGGLDALLGEPDEDPSSGIRFLSEVKRILKPHGRYACITLAQKHVLGLLVSTFRHGWQLGVYQVKLNSEAPSDLRPFLVVAKKGTTNELPLISSVLFDAANAQVQSLKSVLEEEKLLRAGGNTEIDTSKGPATCVFEKLCPGRRITTTLGAKGKSKSTYKAIILDAKERHENFAYTCAVFLVPKSKAHEWLYSSEEGQWQVVESAKAGRLIMVYLETNLQPGNNVHLQDDLSPLVRDLLPSHGVNSRAPFLMPDDGVCQGTLLEEVDSPLTGTMLVEDVILCDKQKDFFRRLFFKRNPNLIQSEALLAPVKGEAGHRRGKKKNHRRQNSVDEMKVDHSYLASPYHEGMIAGLSLVAVRLESWLSSKEQIRAMVVGLGAGLLPMFLYKHLPFHRIQVVELDPVVADLARRHFGFVEDERMQLLIGDGVAAVEALARPGRNGDEMVLARDGLNGELNRRPLHVLIIDADSSDPSNGLSCPPMDFLLESFLSSAKAALMHDGILIINLVSRARDPHVQAISRLCKIFEEVYSLQIDEDVNRVLFALPQAGSLKDSAGIQNAAVQLKKIATQFAPWGNGPNVKDIVKNLKRLK